MIKIVITPELATIAGYSDGTSCALATAFRKHFPKSHHISAGTSHVTVDGVPYRLENSFGFYEWEKTIKGKTFTTTASEIVKFSHTIEDYSL